MMTKPSEHGAMAKLMVAAARMRRDEYAGSSGLCKVCVDVDVNMISSV